MSQCTFGGFDIVRPSPEVYARLDRFWDENAPDMWVFPGYLTARLDHLPIPYPPAHRRAPFNILVWPRGASRWAEFHCLMEGATLAALQASLGGGPSPGCPTLPATLLLNDDNSNFSVSPTMYMIAARPIYLSPDGTPTTRAGQLYWVTLVDNRYFWWQQQPTFDFVAGDDWTTLLTNLLAAATPTTATIPSIPGAYGKPSPIRWGQAGVPLPLLIDAAATQVGLRFVIQTNGTAAFVNSGGAATADLTQYNTITSTYRPPSMGGRITLSEVLGGIPANVVVGFWGDVMVYVTVNLRLLALPAYGGCAGVANSSAWIQADQNAYILSPSQSSAALQYATDYYGWRLSFTDATWSGVFNLQLTGLEDRLEWEWAGRRAVPVDDDSPKNPLVDGEVPGVRILSRIVRDMFGDANIYGDRAPPGYTYQCVLTAQVAGQGCYPQWNANIRVLDPVTGCLIDGPQLGFGQNAPGVLYEDTGSPYALGTARVGDHVYAVPDPLTPNAWTFISNPGRSSSSSSASSSSSQSASLSSSSSASSSSSSSSSSASSSSSQSQSGSGSGSSTSCCFTTDTVTGFTHTFDPNSCSLSVTLNVTRTTYCMVNGCPQISSQQMLEIT